MSSNGSRSWPRSRASAGSGGAADHRSLAAGARDGARGLRSRGIAGECGCLLLCERALSPCHLRGLSERLFGRAGPAASRPAQPYRRLQFEPVAGWRIHWRSTRASSKPFVPEMATTRSGCSANILIQGERLADFIASFDPRGLEQNPFKMNNPRLCHPGAAKQSPGSLNAATQTGRDGAETAVFMGSAPRFAAPE